VDSDKNKKLKVSIILPTYNRPNLLYQAIKSILNQTYQNFEIIIIDDGLEKRSYNIIKKINDRRIKYIKNIENKGASFSRNIGIKNSTGKYIALLDDDDIWIPNKLEIQINFLKKNPQIGVVGSWVKFLNSKKINKMFSNPDKIKTNLLFGSTMVHSTIIIRKEILDKNNLKYDEDLLTSEDYDLWNKLSKYTKFYNIKKFLVKYKEHENNLTNNLSATQKQISIQLRKKQLEENLDIDPSNKDMIIHQSIYRPENINLQDYLKRKEMWFNKLIEQNKKTKFYKEPEFSQVLAQRWLKICSVNSNKDFKIFKYFWKSGLRKKLDWKEFESWKMTSRFFIKCLI